MMAAALHTTSARRDRALRGLLIGVVALLALAEVLAIYVILPGRAPATFTAMQPDSVAYVCQGLQMSGIDPALAHEVSSTVFTTFGYPPDFCSTAFAVIPWQVFARPLLPGLIAASAGILHTSWSVLLPSIGIFGILTALWLAIVLPRRRRPGVRDWILAVAPFTAITMILWPAGVLTEGPVVVLSLLSVVLLAMPPLAGSPGEPARGSARMRAVIVLSGLGLAGLALLLTRQSWPIVGAFWAAGLMQQAWRAWPGGRARAVSYAIASAAVGFGLAITCARLFEALLIPAGLKERQKYVPEGLVLQDVPAMVWSSITSTANDIVIAVSRGDVISPVMLVAGVVALILLIRNRDWALAWVCGVSWALGFYAVGLVQVFDDASRTHLRFLVQATFMSIGALVIVKRRHET